MEEYLLFAKTIVREASLLVKGMTHISDVKYTKDHGDLVTGGDLAVHDYIRGRLRGAYPDHGFLSEEANDNRTDTDCVWILDPIDGTKYFSRHIPIYSISLALRIKGEMTLGVVHNPETQQMFAARLGGGAMLNGKPIHCSTRSDIKDCIVCLEAPSRHDPDEERVWMADVIRRLTDRVLRIRMIGAVAHSLCWTAMGGFDAYLNLKRGTSLWDIAAGQVILQEAGARYSNRDGRIIGAPPALYDQFDQLLGL